MQQEVGLTQDDITNTISLIGTAPITGGQAVTVAVLVQKYEAMLRMMTQGKPEPVPEIAPPPPADDKEAPVEPSAPSRSERRSKKKGR